MLGLMVSALVMVLAASLLAIAQRNLQMQKQLTYTTLAFQMAENGLEYYRVESEDFVAGTPVAITVDTPGYAEVFSVEVTGTGDIRSTGIIRSTTGQLLAQRIIVVPVGDFSKMYDEGR